MSAQPYDRRLDADSQPITIAIVQALLAAPGVTGPAVGYAGVGQRVYPEASVNPDESGGGDDYPYLIVVCVSAVVEVDATTARMDALYDLVTVDRGHTPNNFSGGTQNVVGVAQAAWTALTQFPLTATGYTNLELRPVSGPRGTSSVQSGIVFRQRRCSVRVQGNWSP